MTRQAISTTGAPGAIGPYSQAIDTGDIVFCSGFIGLDPATGELVEGGIEAQVERAMRNLAAVLDAAGLSFGDVVKTTCYLVDLGDFATFNKIYGSYLTEPPPARTTIQAGALPKGALVEVEAVARRARLADAVAR
jgi:2-iminobutanoate/2-iminopropanoate deaminase